MHNTFSIVVISYGHAVELRAALDSIDAFRYPREAFEVIVVDDGTVPRIDHQIFENRSYKIRAEYLARSDRSSRARARNYGAGLAANDWLVFVDGDQYLGSELLDLYNTYLLSEGASQVVLGTRMYLGEWQSHMLIESNNFESVKKIRMRRDIRLRMQEGLRKNIMRMPGSWTLFWSHNFLINKNVFQAVGGFDEAFINWGFEDTEFGYRLVKSGIDISLLENYVFNLHQKIAFSQEKYRGWLANLEYFYNKYKDFCIISQLVLYHGFNLDPDDREFPAMLERFNKFSADVSLLGGG